MIRVLITGATGNMGQATIEELLKHNTSDLQIIAGVRDKEKAQRKLSKYGKLQLRTFDFKVQHTIDHALDGIDKVLLVRPPAISDVKKYILPFIKTAKAKGVQQIVFLSLQGVEKNPIVPHYKIEKYIKEEEIPYTFLRPSFFMQNLSTTHRLEIKENNELFIPAGNGKTNFIDVRDIAEVASLVLREQGHINKAYELTGDRGYTYYEVAKILSKVLNRTITYKNPSVLKFFLRKKKEGMPIAKIIVMIGLYTVAKLGKANQQSKQLEQLLGRAPIPLRMFIEDYKEIWY